MKQINNKESKYHHHNNWIGGTNPGNKRKIPKKTSLRRKCDFKKVDIVGNKAEERISKWVFQENKAHQVLEKRVGVCMYQGVRNVCFSGNLAWFVVLKHPFWDSRFCFISVDILLSHERFSRKLSLQLFFKTSAEQSCWTKIYWVKKWKNVLIPQLLLSRMLSIILKSVFCRLFQQVLW